MIKGAVLGSPIGHSLSPLLHRSAYEFLGVEGSYTAIEVKSGELARFTTIDPENFESFDYFSLTMPLKEELVRLGIRRDPLAVRIQSANTLFKRDGQWSATSTDGSGFVQALSDVDKSALKKILILGAGGTARAVAGAMNEISQDIHVASRNEDRKKSMAECITKAEFTYLSWEEMFDFSFYDLVINTTPAGVADHFVSQVPSRIESIFFDVLYKPLPTPLSKKWMESGGRTFDGIELLIHQGIDQLALILDLESSRKDLATHLRKVLRSSV